MDPIEGELYLSSINSRLSADNQEITDKPLEPKALFETLNEGTDAGLVKNRIASREDQPTLPWKHGL